MISNKKAIESARVISDYCNEQKSCQNCIFREFGEEHWKCHIEAFDLQDVLSNAEKAAENRERGMNQEAKADAGKLELDLVPRQIIRDIARLQQYEKMSQDGQAPAFLKVTERKKGKWYAMFRCQHCGMEFEAQVNNVLSGNTKSCGCYARNCSSVRKQRHGDSGSRLYTIYHHILERCNSPKCREYKWYGARGIKCEFTDYTSFRGFALANGYTDELTVERVDVNGNYSPNNIKFIPKQMQAWNTTRSVFIDYKGIRLCAAEWSKILGINQDTLTKRKRKGWDDARIVETTTDNTKHPITYVPPEIISDILEVRKWSLTKYPDPDNWKTVELRRYINAMLRHTLAFLDDMNGVDTESGLAHYKHACCNWAFICEMMEWKRHEAV